MRQEHTDLKEKIERCERLAQSQTDEDMRQALEELAEDYRAQLKRRVRPFMLGGEEESRRSAGGSAAGAR